MNDTHTHDIDLSEFRAGLRAYQDGDWHEDRWKTFRLRFGIYEQRQSAQHMVRVKVPGGRLPFGQARAIAAANAAHAGGDIHVTTRQGLQLYFTPMDRLGELLTGIYDGGATTREASGNTFRAITACPHAGSCVHELTDAATVAQQLTQTWLRHPLTQHMPRKFKTTVSGCARDCGLSAIDDLGLIAVEKDGAKGFRVMAGGGLGIAPSQAVEVFDFVSEHDLPRVQEAFARVHQARSDRTNKNRARIKFLLKKLGKEAFVSTVRAAFLDLENLDGPAWAALDWSAWQDAGRDAGRKDVEIDVPLGWLSSDQLSALADFAETAGGRELRLTRGQNIIAVGLDPAHVGGFVEAIRGWGLDASGRAYAFKDLVACPGTSTCAIGIADSFALAETLVDAQAEFADVAGVRLRISGCHNSCGHHHVADVGLHGMAKKIDGEAVPHYQFHLGGGVEAHGIAGPVVPARKVKEALKLLLKALHSERHADESVRAWVERVGLDHVHDLITPALELTERERQALRYDFGHDAPFTPPATSTGECAAGAMVAEHLADLARVAVGDALRAHRAGRDDAEIRQHLLLALDYPLQRLLSIAGEDLRETCDARVAAVRDHWSRQSELLAALDLALQAVERGDVEHAVPVLDAWRETVDAEVERILAHTNRVLGAYRRAGAPPENTPHDWQPPALGRIAS